MTTLTRASRRWRCRGLVLVLRAVQVEHHERSATAATSAAMGLDVMHSGCDDGSSILGIPMLSAALVGKLAVKLLALTTERTVIT